MLNSTPFPFQLPPGNQTTILRHGPSLAVWLHRAEEILSNEGLRLPLEDRLMLTVKAAVEVCDLYFAAAVQEPTPAHIYNCFEDFLVRSLSADRNEKPKDPQ